MELLRVVTSEAVGAPELALFVAVFPMAPDPLVPEVSTPANVTTNIDDTTFCEIVAVTEAFESTFGAKARHTSEVPIWVFVRLTSAQVSPPPVTFETVMFGDNASVLTKASSNSFPTAVEKIGLLTLVAALA